jgi:hypothetical protein
LANQRIGLMQSLFFKSFLLFVKGILNCFYNCVRHCNCIGQVVKNKFWHYEHFWQSINAILWKLVSWIIGLTTSCNTLLTHDIKSLLIVLSCKSKWYFWIVNFKSFKCINLIIYIYIYIPKNWTSCHIDYSHKTMIPCGILMSFAIT